MSELWQHGALELAAQIRSGATTSRAVMEAHLGRLDAVNPQLNAVVRVMADEALAAADRADQAVERGDELGPLHGVPCTVKENVDVAGTPTTQGVPALAEAVVPVDAPVVERLRAAGAIPFARTNLPDFGLRIHTHSTLHGLTRNPWHPDVTAGGSSGGEASAIASGISPLGLGNDIGGSLRNPAHCCGIASLKPTVGVVPSARMIPPEDAMLAEQQMAVEGPMARRVADVRAGLDAIAGWSHRDPVSVPAQLRDLADGERLSVALVATPPGGRTHPEIASAVRLAADALANAGHDVVETTPPEYELVLDMWAQLLVGDLTVSMPILDEVMSDDAASIVHDLIAQYPAPTVDSIVGLQAERNRLMRAWSGFFADHPIVLSPTWAMPAFPHGADVGGDLDGLVRDTLRPVLPANFLGLPAAIVPSGMAAGLPVGAQVIGDRFTDLRCLTIAGQIEQAIGTITPIDPVT